MLLMTLPRLVPGGEGFAEGFAGAVEAEFDSFGGGVGDFGDLFVAEVLVGGEDEGFPLVFRQGGDGGLDSGEFFFGGGVLMGIGGGVGGA